MKQTLSLGGREIQVDFKKLKQGDSFGDWEYIGNSTQEGNPLWAEFVNTKTGESSMRSHTPKKILDTDHCDHFYEYIDNHNNIQCVKCEDGRKLITGYHALENGKIIQKIPPKPAS